MTDSSRRSHNSQAAGKGSESRATHAILQGLPQGKPEMVAIETELTISTREATIQKVRDALQERNLSFGANGRGPYKILVPRDAAERVNTRVFGSAFAQVKKLGLSNRLFFVTLKEGTDEQIVNLFCKGAIGFGQVVLRTLPWIQDKKEYIDVLHRRGLVWNIVSTDDQSLNAEEIEGFLRDTYPDAQDFKLLSAKRAHVKLFSTPKEPPATLNVAWERAGCCGVCGRFGHVAANCPCPKTACLKCGGAHPTHLCKERKAVRLGEKEIVALLCQAYDALTNSWSPRAQKLLIELSSCSKAKRREAVMDLVAQNFEATVLPLLQKVKETQKPKRPQKRKQRKAAESSKASGSEMVDVPTAPQQVEDRIETQREGGKRSKNLGTRRGPAARHEPTAPTTPKPRQRGRKRTRAERSPDQSDITKYTTPAPRTPTLNSAEPTPEPSTAKAPAQGSSGNKLTRKEGEKNLREKERNNGDTSVPPDSKGESQVMSPDSSSGAPCSDGTNGTQPLAVTPLQAKPRNVQGEESSLQSVTSTSDCGQKNMEVESC